MSTSPHAWGAGSNLPLASLSNISDQLYGYNRQSASAPRRAVGITTEIEDLFPVAKTTLDYAVSGAGMGEGALTLTLFASALKFVGDTYFSSRTVKSVAMTLYAPRLELGTNDRMNVYLVWPGRDDVTYLRYGLIRARFVYHIVSVL